MGRPSKLTQDTQERLLRAIRAASTLESACRYAGVGYNTVRGWVARGQATKSGEYWEFSQALTRAEQDLRIDLQEKLIKAGATDWRAIIALMERRWPEEWGRKDRVSVVHVLKEHTDAIAEELGINPEDVLADAERILASLS